MLSTRDRAKQREYNNVVKCTSDGTQCWVRGRAQTNLPVAKPHRCAAKKYCITPVLLRNLFFICFLLAFLFTVSRSILKFLVDPIYSIKLRKQYT